MKLKQVLKSKLTKNQLKLLPSSFDIIGTIALFLSFPEQLKNKEKLVAQTLLKLNKNIKTVAKKTQHYKGKYRLQKVKIIAGKRTKTTIHKENNVLLKLNIQTCYFSPRLASERLRIASLVKPNEKILCLFSGICSYPLTIAKNARPKEIYAIDINPQAHKFAIENIMLNKVTNIKPINKDVKKLTLKKKFDRILMPLPKSAETFLKYALKYTKKHTIIHFYDFQRNPKNSIKKLKKHIKKFKVLKIKKCGQISPRKYRFCIDLEVL